MLVKDWYTEQCNELEELDKKGISDLMYMKVAQLTKTTKKCTQRNSAIKDTAEGRC